MNNIATAMNIRYRYKQCIPIVALMLYIQIICIFAVDIDWCSQVHINEAILKFSTKCDTVTMVTCPFL